MHGQKGVQPTKLAMTAPHVRTVAGALVSAVVLNTAGAVIAVAVQMSDKISAPALLQADDMRSLFIMGWTVGLAASIPIIRAIGLGRFVIASGALFAVSSVTAFGTQTVELFSMLRLVQGIATGGLGPLAFIAIFTVMREDRLMLGLALLAWALALPTNLAPIIALSLSLGLSSALVCCVIAGSLVVALGKRCFAHTPINLSALQADWSLLSAVAITLSAAVMLLGPGQITIPGGLAATAAIFFIGSAVTIVLIARGSTTIDLGLLHKRHFVVPIVINFQGRMAAAALLAISISHAISIGNSSGASLLHCVSALIIGQGVSLPLAQSMRRKFDCRTVMASGITLSFILALWLGSVPLGASLLSILLPLSIQAVGHTLFIIANLQSGAARLLPAEGPTATILFNGSTMLAALSGGALATGLLAYSQSSALIMLQQPGLIGSAALLLLTALALLPAVLEPETEQKHNNTGAPQ